MLIRMSLLYDLQSVFGTPRSAFILFLISVAFDIDMFLSPALVRYGVIRPAAWGTGAHVAAVVVEVIVIAGASLLLLLMIFDAFVISRRGVAERIILAIAFILGVWITAQFYYLIYYRRVATAQARDRSITATR
jgi:hypothetical protein